MRKILIIMTIIAVAAAGVFVATRKKSAPSYREILPELGTIAVEFRETGSVKPRNRLEIKPPIAGRIEEVAVVEGQKVSKGDVIAWLSSSERAALLDAARAKGEDEIKKWEEIYRPTPIIAPLSGFIIARSKEPGQTVGQSDALLVMADTLIVEADVDETDLRYIALGQKVGITLDAYPDAPFKGVVEHIAYESQVINNVTVYSVKIRPESVPANFRAGMTATVRVKAERREKTLLLPFEAVTDKDGMKTVRIKTQGKRPEVRPVRTGMTNGKKIEVVEGLAESDVVLVSLPQGKDRERRRGGLPGMPGMGKRR